MPDPSPAMSSVQEVGNGMASLQPPNRPYATSSSEYSAAPSTSTHTSHTHISADNAGESNDAAHGAQLSTSHDLTVPEPSASAENLSSEALAPQDPQADPLSSSSQDPPPQVPQMPQTFLTFLLISGKRRTMSFEPETTVGRVKELVWNTWPGEWQDDRPPAPSYFRILYLGKMLQDDDTLTKLKLPAHMPQSHPAPIPTIVHLSIRPHLPPGDSDGIKKKKRNRNNNATDSVNRDADDATAGGSCCGCVIC